MNCIPVTGKGQCKQRHRKEKQYCEYENHRLGLLEQCRHGGGAGVVGRSQVKAILVVVFPVTYTLPLEAYVI